MLLCHLMRKFGAAAVALTALTGMQSLPVTRLANHRSWIAARKVLHERLYCSPVLTVAQDEVAVEAGQRVVRYRVTAAAPGGIGGGEGTCASTAATEPSP